MRINGQDSNDSGKEITDSVSSAVDKDSKVTLDSNDRKPVPTSDTLPHASTKVVHLEHMEEEEVISTVNALEVCPTQVQETPQKVPLADRSVVPANNGSLSPDQFHRILAVVTTSLNNAKIPKEMVQQVQNNLLKSEVDVLTPKSMSNSENCMIGEKSSTASSVTSSQDAKSTETGTISTIHTKAISGSDCTKPKPEEFTLTTPVIAKIDAEHKDAAPVHCVKDGNVDGPNKHDTVQGNAKNTEPTNANTAETQSCVERTHTAELSGTMQMLQKKHLQQKKMAENGLAARNSSSNQSQSLPSEKEAHLLLKATESVSSYDTVDKALLLHMVKDQSPKMKYVNNWLTKQTSADDKTSQPDTKIMLDTATVVKADLDNVSTNTDSSDSIMSSASAAHRKQEAL